MLSLQSSTKVQLDRDIHNWLSIHAKLWKNSPLCGGGSTFWSSVGGWVGCTQISVTIHLESFFVWADTSPIKIMSSVCFKNNERKEKNEFIFPFAFVRFWSTFKISQVFIFLKWHCKTKSMCISLLVLNAF